MLLIFVVVAFLFWFLFMRKREGFLEGAAAKANPKIVKKGVVAKPKTNCLIKIVGGERTKVCK